METKTLEFEGLKLELPALSEDLPVDVIEKFEDDKVIGFVRSLLGDENWTKFKATQPSMRDFGRLADAIAKVYGFESVGGILGLRGFIRENRGALTADFQHVYGLDLEAERQHAVSFERLRRLADLVLHVASYGPVAIAPPDPEQFSMESSREITTDDFIRLHPGLFAEN